MNGLPRPTPRGLQVLVVDDEPAVLRVVENLFASYGWRTASASNVRDALVAVDRAPPPDLIVSDVLLRSGTGLDLLAALGSRLLDLHIGLVFHSGSHGEAARALRQRGYRVLGKPESLRPLERIAMTGCWNSDCTDGEVT